MNAFGFVRVAVCSPRVAVGNPAANAAAIVDMLGAVADADVVVFPELALTGYTCGDLFRQDTLLRAACEALGEVRNATRGSRRLVFVGCPLVVGDALHNCAVAIQAGRIRGVVPKTHVPNYGEFYEARWFRGAAGGEPAEIEVAGERVGFGTDLLFRPAAAAGSGAAAVVAVEICEDLWMPIPPSSHAALAGANLLVNLSASNETVGKHEYREALVRNQSARCLAAYAYAAAGPGESTTDLVFGGHCLVAENGQLLAESVRVGHPDEPLPAAGWQALADVDVERLAAERRLRPGFATPGPTAGRRFRDVPLEPLPGAAVGLRRRVDGRPFVPADPARLRARCAEVFGIQCAGLAKRLAATGLGDVVIGVSGGLDSTLALLVAAKAFATVGLDPRRIRGVTLPGFGTTARTRANALALVAGLGVTGETIDIRPLCLATFAALGHRPFGIDPAGLDVDAFERRLAGLPPDRRHDLVFENVQARERTKLLMARGFVIGTGDLSELALGWCTYNADHMSMYAVNASVPKTLVRFLVEHVAATDYADHPLRRVLLDVAATPISPELLPPAADGGIAQATEAVLGPYELHDFFLAGFMRFGFSPEKLLFLSDHAEFSQPYPRELRARTLRTFLTRFFAQQYKRSCVPDGPKVGAVSLSPRGDWRMPSDADPAAWLRDG